MWFKTKTGLVRIEGTVELTLTRFVDRKMHAHKLGIYAYQYRHPEGELRVLWRRLMRIYNRRIYLACFPDSSPGEQEAAACMVHIEKAIRSNETLCDVSGFGSVEHWGSRWTTFVKWPHDPVGE